MADCRGLCQDSCRSPFDVSALERDRVEARAGRPLIPGDGCRACSMLTPVGRCRVYGDRPMVCRLFGTASSLRCEHGCRPQRWLTDSEVVELMVEAFDVGGWPAGVEPMNAEALADFERRNPGTFASILGALRATR